MELLTGKALADFNHYVHNNTEYNDYDLPRESYRVLESLIIEWLDNVGVYLMIGRYGYTINIDDVGSWSRKESRSRFEITQQAIIHANKIYNER